MKEALQLLLLFLSFAFMFMAGWWTRQHLGYDIERAFRIARHHLKQRLDRL